MTSLGWVLEDGEQRKIELRRTRLQERAKRIHDPTATVVSRLALDEQLAEVQERQHREARELQVYQQQVLQCDALAQLRTEAHNQEREQRQVELKHFWEEQRAGVEQRHRSEQLRHRSEQPYQLSFAGEDPALCERQRLQVQEKQEWLALQVQEKQRNKLQEMREERKQDDMAAQLAAHSEQLRAAEELCKKAEQLAVTELNAALAEETTQRHQLEKRRDLEADLHHVQGAVNGNFLTEAPEVARSRLAPDRVLCDRWKGLTAAQRLQNYDQLRAQIRCNKEKRASLEAEDRQWQQQATELDRQAQLAHRQQAHYTRDLREQLRALNEELSEQQRLQRAAEQHIYGTNQPTEEFFDHFGVYAR